MRTRYSEDQEAVAEAFGALFAREATGEAVRSAAAGCGFDRALWDKLASAGAPGMAAPVACGGGGASLVDLAVVVHEWGRRIAPVPLVEHAVSARLLCAAAGSNAPGGPGGRDRALSPGLLCAAAGSNAPGGPGGRDRAPSPGLLCAAAGSNAPGGPGGRDRAPSPGLLCAAAGSSAPHDVLDAVVSGELVATLALRPLEADGTARLVPAGAVADVVAGIREGALVVGRSEPPGAARPNTADLPLADRDLSGAEILAAGEAARRAWHDALAEWKALMAVAYAGLASEVLAMGVAYVKQRHQFGVAVGSFQAVQHGLADAATRAEGARLLAFRAACAVDAGQTGGDRLASMALLFGAESARFAADRVLQYHGGYGYSAEYDVQLYYRRAAAWLLQLGEPAAEMARLAEAGLGPKRPSG